jgi:hypothetical protein
MSSTAPWTKYLASRAALQPDLTELEAARWEDETMCVLLREDPGVSMYIPWSNIYMMPSSHVIDA